MTELQNYMASHGETLIANGYSILPIMPNKKIPGALRDGVWHPMPDWSRLCDRETKGYEFQIWSRYPGCAVGLACGRVIGIDIDVLDDKVAFSLEKLAREMLGDTPAMRIGRAPKRALYYRAVTPFRGKKMHPLEVYGRGSQMVVYGIHPDTGRPYEWPGESLTEIDISSLPEIAEAQAMAWLEEAYKRTPAELKPKTISSLSSGDVSAWKGPSDPLGTYEAIKSALEFIPNDDLDGTSWITMLNALKSALGEEGRDLWLNWSKSSAKSGASGKSDTAERRWDTARPTSVGAGSIYYLAQQRGWVPDSHLVLNGNEVQDGTVHPAAALIAKAARMHHAREKGVSTTIGLDPLIMGGMSGLMRDIHEHIVSTSTSPQPFLALGAALCIIGAAAGRRYRSVSNIRTNVLVMAVADSGSGKDRPLKCVANCLIDAGLDNFIAGSKVASATAIVTALREHPVTTFALDEIGHMIGINSGKKAGSHQAEILPLITEIYSKAGDKYLGINFANSELNKRQVIHQPHLVIFGATVPGTLWKAFSSGSVADGSLARWLLFKSPENYPDPNEEIYDFDTPQHIKDGIRAVAGLMPEGTGNLSGINTNLMSSSETLLPLLVEETHEAGEAIKQRRRDELAQKRANEGTPRTSVLARLTEHTIRVALIRAISRNPSSPVIELEDVEWSCALVDHCVGSMLAESDQSISDNETEANHKKVLAIITKAGTITSNDLARRTQSLGKNARGDILASLVEAGQIVKLVSGEGKPGRNSVTYSIAA